MKKLLIWGLSAYPVLWIIGWITKTNVMMNYHQFILQWWPILLTGFITYLLLKDIELFRTEEMESMRERRYLSELARFRDTPYISPLMVMYMTNPPQAFSQSTYDQVHNTFYRTVVNHFRDRVFIHADYNRMQPIARQAYWKTVGLKKTIRLFFYLGISSIWLSYWMVVNSESLISGWQLFTLPLVVVGIVRGTIILQAISEHIPTRLEKELGTLMEISSWFTWRDAFPDQYFGKSILRAYEAEKESRMRYQALLTKTPVPYSTENYHNPSFAPFPFPALQLPEWADEMTAYYQEKKEQWKQGPQKSNVIQLHKKTKKAR